MGFENFEDYFNENWSHISLLTGMDEEDLRKQALKGGMSESEFYDLISTYFAECDVCGFKYNKLYERSYLELNGNKVCRACMEFLEFGRKELERLGEKKLL